MDVELKFKTRLQQHINVLIYYTVDNQVLMDKDANVTTNFD